MISKHNLLWFLSSEAGVTFEGYSEEYGPTKQNSHSDGR